MPRKRASKAKSANIPKPEKRVFGTLNETEEDEKAEQLELMLKEFDSKVNSYLKEFEKQKRAMNVTISQRYNKLLSSLSLDMQAMTVKEFCQAGGTFESATASLNKEKNTLKPTSTNTNIDRMAELQNLLCTGMPRKLEKVMEEEGQEVDVKNEVTNTKKRPAKTTMAPPSTSFRKSKRNQNATPATRVSKMDWGQTPLITPKFDPNLPSTPDNIRKLRPGERVMSLAGSPIEIEFSEAKPSRVPTLADYDLTPHRMEEMLKHFYGTSEDEKSTKF